MALRDYLGEQILGVLASYQASGIVHHICVVYPRRDNQLQLFIPKGHALAAGSLVTLHLDNRTGVDELDAELRVYRTSYKGRVQAVDENWATVTPVEFSLIHGIKVVESQREPGYEFPADPRPSRPLADTPLTQVPEPEAKDHPNKIGVLTTLTPQQPHTTVMAFLSSEDDDVFIITRPGTFKSQVLKRESRCFFTIDERAKFTFDQSIHWNYTILEMQAYVVPKTAALYEPLRAQFILKNPWEAAFFMETDIEMFHLRRAGVVCAGEAR
jgi:hypothetical protein